jgi:hypothetical protein
MKAERRRYPLENRVKVRVRNGIDVGTVDTERLITSAFWLVAKVDHDAAA